MLDQSGERLVAPLEGGVAGRDVGDGPPEHDEEVGGVGERPAAVGPTGLADIAGGVRRSEGGIEGLEALDEDGVDQAGLAPEPRVDARGRAAGLLRDVADRERGLTVPGEHDEGGVEDRPAGSGVDTAAVM